MMMAPPREKQVAFLRHVPLLRHFDDRLLGALAGIMTLKRVTQGEYLCEEGGPGDACFIIGAGSIDVTKGRGNDEQVLCSLGPGHVVGEVALVDGKPRSASVRCKTDVSVFVLLRGDFQQLLFAGNKASIRLLDNIARALAGRVRAANESYSQIFSNPGETMAVLTSKLQDLQASMQADPVNLEEEGGQDGDLMEFVGYEQLHKN